MPTIIFSGLDAEYGSENVARLLLAYEVALAAAQANARGQPVDTEIRLQIVQSLLSEAQRGNFDEASLKTVALAVVSHLPPHSRAGI